MKSEKTFAIWRENNIYGRSSERSALCLAGDPDRILRIRQSDVPAEELPDNAVRMDTEYDNPDAEHKIYGWLTDDGTMNYWTDADMTRMTDESCSLFSGLSNVTEIDISGIDTSDIKDMSFMFASCSSLKSLDLSSFDTSKVTSMYGMFQDCSKLTSLDISDFDTSNVTNMEYMFAGCSHLTSLDLSHFDTSNVTSMNSMFCGCSSLTSLDLSSFDTSNVTNMYRMFDGCSSLKSISVSETAETRKMLKESGIEPKGHTTQHKSRHQHER